MSAVPRVLAIMGSGETTPTMARVHRALLARLADAGRPVRATVLDTPYGFQENAEDISARAVDYFRETVGTEFSVASLRRADADALERETALLRVREADYVFSGPGSPTYALRQWRETEIPRLLAGKLAAGGIVTVASAAALTVGRFTVPVYEIYKAGEPPRWLEGLDLLSPLGLPVAVVPHYDNAEGGNHDTRYCYLGERRLRLLEAELPPDVFILGVDGHTALVLDLAAGSALVLGLGSVTVRRDGRSTSFPAGTELRIDELGAAAGRSSGFAATRPHVEPAPGPRPPAARPFEAELARLEADFSTALDGGDPSGAAGAALELDATILEWSRDTEESEILERARSALRAMVVRLGEAAVGGTRDPAELLAPFVEALLDDRARARSASDWELADSIRDRLLAAGVELHDTPDGTAWELRSRAGERVS